MTRSGLRINLELKGSRCWRLGQGEGSSYKQGCLFIIKSARMVTCEVDIQLLVRCDDTYRIYVATNMKRTLVCSGIVTRRLLLLNETDF